MQSRRPPPILSLNLILYPLFIVGVACLSPEAQGWLAILYRSVLPTLQPLSAASKACLYCLPQRPACNACLPACLCCSLTSWLKATKSWSSAASMTGPHHQSSTRSCSLESELGRGEAGGRGGGVRPPGGARLQGVGLWHVAIGSGSMVHAAHCYYPPALPPL